MFPRARIVGLRVENVEPGVGAEIDRRRLEGVSVIGNAGSERFNGVEYEGDFLVRPESRIEFGYSYHDARFRDFVQAFDGVPTQLAGHRIEMSPLHLMGAGFIYAPPQGLTANVTVNYVGERYLNKRNTARAAAYNT